MAKTSTPKEEKKVSSTSRKIRKIRVDTMEKFSDTQLEVLSRHYSETSELVRLNVAQRERLFYYLLTTIFLLSLYMSAPVGAIDLLNSYVWSRIGNSQSLPATNIIGESLVNIVLLFGLFNLSYNYFQAVLGVERLLEYVFQLEKQLSQHFNEHVFSRESVFYRSHRRNFSTYSLQFPVLFMLFIIIWLWFLFTSSQAPLIYKIVDTLITVSILISVGYYILALIKRKK